MVRWFFVGGLNGLLFLGMTMRAQHNSFAGIIPTHILLSKNLEPILFSSRLNGLPIQKNQTPIFQMNSNTKLPVFCAMEDKLHKRLNIWIKLRTGSDDYYRGLIDTPKSTAP